MMANAGEPTTEPAVVSTSDVSKLPPGVAALLDPAIPVPIGTTFFEKRYEVADLFWRMGMSIVFAFMALVCIPFGISWMFRSVPVTVYSKVDYLPLVFGLICALAAWMMAASVFTCYGLRQRQLAGQSVRRGIFLTPTALVQAGESDTTVIPPAHFRGIDGQTIKYHHNAADRTFKLPAALTNGTPEELHAAVTRWAAGHG